MAPLPSSKSPAPLPERRIVIGAAAIRGLDLSPLAAWAALDPASLLGSAASVELLFEWPREAEDPRELSEIPELRLWSLRADACHPWLPLILERSGGQLTRHVAMLLPHGFQRTEGIRFAPESLELWLTHRLFLLDHWLRLAGLNGRAGLGQMAAVLGFELDPAFWSPLPVPPAGAAPP
ncbi:MAG: CRR6 family NdhI maturation factor [Synechococcaceae cyanobacterium]|jgi:hypothetical protein